MSNHHHTILFDRHGNVPAFMHRFHELFAKSQNVLRGRWENFWAAGEPSLVWLVTRDDVIAKMAYVAANPVSAFLVAETHHWPGTNTWSRTRPKPALVARRPRHFFRVAGPMPEKVELDIVVPPQLGDAATFLQEVADRVAMIEAACDAERRTTGRRIVGRRQVLKASWKLGSNAPEQRRGLNPRIAAKSLEARLGAIARWKSFLHRYRVARRKLRDSGAAVFPYGTYWLRIHVGVPTEPPETVFAEPTTTALRISIANA
jgi:hypothetical protein